MEREWHLTNPHIYICPQSAPNFQVWFTSRRQCPLLALDTKSRSSWSTWLNKRQACSSSGLEHSQLKLSLWTFFHLYWCIHCFQFSGRTSPCQYGYSRSPACAVKSDYIQRFSREYSTSWRNSINADDNDQKLVQRSMRAWSELKQMKCTEKEWVKHTEAMTK